MYKCPKCGNTGIFRKDIITINFVNGKGDPYFYGINDYCEEIQMQCDKCDYKGSEDEFKE